MFDQVIDLFAAEYGVDRDRQAEVFRRFYEAPFQRDQGMRIVAVDGHDLIGVPV